MLLLSYNMMLLFMSRSDSEDVAVIPLIFCLSGIVFFAIMYFRYRNSEKRHMHERDTATVTKNEQAFDQFVEHRYRLRNASMHGANDSRIEGAQDTGIAAQAIRNFVENVDISIK